MELPAPDNDFQIRHARLLLASYRRFVGQALIEGATNDRDAARRLFQAEFSVVSHDCRADPILTYGNEAALRLWEADWDVFTSMPSRLTAEPMERDARLKLLRAVEQNGFIDQYCGVRISAKGRRFWIDNAIIWTLVDDENAVVGQAATFGAVRFL